MIPIKHLPIPIAKDLAVIPAYVWFLVFRNIHLANLHHKTCRLCWMACQEASGEDAVCITIPVVLSQTRINLSPFQLSVIGRPDHLNRFGRSHCKVLRLYTTNAKKHAFIDYITKY